MRSQVLGNRQDGDRFLGGDLQRDYEVSVLPGGGRDGLSALMKLLIGLRYRVGGILHEYLGPARLPGGSDIAHVFLRNEWRPNTPDQLPLTIVEEPDVDGIVTKTRIKGRRR